MFETAAFAYSLLASFVLSSALRNTRQQRPHGRAIRLLGLLVMSMSLTLGTLLLGWAAWSTLSAA